jgi:nucleoside-diphosphate-sugar epimerase
MSMPGSPASIGRTLAVLKRQDCVRQVARGDAMRVLFIGGTGNISTACTRRALEQGLEVFHLNRGSRPERVPAGVVTLQADIRDRDSVSRVLAGRSFGAVVNWLGFTPDQVEADVALFHGRTAQYVFISSASVYRKPLPHPVITESTPVGNPYWLYARNKIACEAVLERAGAADGFPCTVVRPSHTYDDGWIPSGFGSRDYTVARRMLEGRAIVVHGDGQSLWTLTHASDFARGFVGLLGNPAAVGQTFHITADESLTWDAIYGAIGAALGVEPRLVHVPSEFIAAVCPERGAALLGDKTHTVIFDNAKIKRYVPAFHATVPFIEGVRRSLAWFDRHPDAKVIDPRIEAEYETVLAAWKAAMNAVKRA